MTDLPVSHRPCYPPFSVLSCGVLGSALLLYSTPFFISFSIAGCIVVLLYVVLPVQLVYSDDACREAVRRIPPS